MEERVHESAEEILARLERYVALHRPPAPVPVPVDTLIPAREETRPHRRRFADEVAPALVAVAICSLVILLSEWFDTVVAVVVGGALMLVGVVALVRRVPLARAFTFGLVIGALLIRFS